MMMMVMAAPSTDGLRQILDIGELSTRRGVGEIRRKLRELARGRRVPADVAVCAAACRFVAICCVTCWYSLGSDG
jgi:hypothetical protein